MRVLAIDAGNTRIKWALHEGGAWGEQGWVPTREAETLAATLPALPRPERIAVANVAGPGVRELLQVALEAHGVAPRWVAARAAQCGVRSGYADPDQLGADRWAALIGARRRYAGPCLVVNVGTTLTADALAADGVFLGGCIAPGLDLMQDALARNTAQLARAPGKFLFFPDNTADAIASGAVNALAGAVDRMLAYLQQTAEHEALTVLSGGGAEAIAPHLRGRVERVDNVVLEGVLEIACNDE